MSLKKFLHVIKQTLNKEDISSITELENVLKVRNCDIEKPKTKLSVSSRNEYPVKNGFPVSLETLTINRCNLKRFDSRILKLHLLTILDLSGNLLNSLCDSFDCMENLKCLYLQENCFESLPVSIHRGATAERLKLIDLSSNQIRYLPRNISNLRTMHTLKLNNNPLVSIPHSIGNLTELRRLEMNAAQLSCLPWSFCKLKLDFLDVSNNLFDTMPNGVLDSNKTTSLQSPSLLETCCRVILRNRKRFVNFVCSLLSKKKKDLRQEKFTNNILAFSRN